MEYAGEEKRLPIKKIGITIKEMTAASDEILFLVAEMIERTEKWKSGLRKWNPRLKKWNVRVRKYDKRLKKWNPRPKK